MWSNCKYCGGYFENKWTKRKSHYRPSVKKSWLCSTDCFKKWQEENRIKRTTCAVCGGVKKSPYALTCSDLCRAKRKLESTKGKRYNLCNYTAPSIEDYNNMLEILHRKGYVKAKDTKEKWTFTTDGFPGISWFDRVAREAVVSRKASSSKEQQGHEDGVQFQIEEVGARALSLEELLSSTQVGAALLEATMGTKPPYRR